MIASLTPDLAESHFWWLARLRDRPSAGRLAPQIWGKCPDPGGRPLISGRFYPLTWLLSCPDSAGSGSDMRSPSGASNDLTDTDIAEDLAYPSGQ